MRIDLIPTGTNPPDNEYDIALPPLTYPATLKLSDNGTLGTVMRYTDHTQSVSLGTITASYTVKSDPANSNVLIVELENKIYNTTNALTETDKTDYAVTAAGAISLVSASAQIGSDTLTATAN